MEFVVKNFAIVNEADIKVKPFTIFIGSNASGKSYILYLIWSLLTTEIDWEFLSSLMEELYDIIIDCNPKEASMHIKNLFVDIFANFPRLLAVPFKGYLKETFLVSELDKLIGSHSKDSQIIIMNKGEEVLKYIIRSQDTLIVSISDSVIDKVRSSFDISVSAIGRGKLRVEGFIDGERIFNIAIDIRDKSSFIQSFYAIIPSVLFEYLGYCPAMTVPILPDGRAGILRAMDPLSKHLLISRWRTIDISNVDREFFRALSSPMVRIKDRDIAKIADFIEEKLGFKVVTRREQPYIVIKDVESGKIMSLEQSPSGIREIAPLLLFMRYHLPKDSILFVEEPEAHLHPDAQVYVLRGLAMLVNMGVYILMTTHSIHVIDELSNLISMDLIKDLTHKYSQLGYIRDEILSPDIVSIYLFKRDGGVEKVEVSYEGVHENHMDMILNEIANVYTTIQNIIGQARSRHATKNH